MSTSDSASGRPRVALVILDGWGLREPADDNAVAVARTPAWDALWESGNHPRATLRTSGRAVGLPDGQMGNSEVGHLNLGAGRVVAQSIQRITEAIESGAFFENEALTGLISRVAERGGTLHLMGLLGPGGVHAVDTHLQALCQLAERSGLPRVRLHLFLDGRDTPPRSAGGYLDELRARLPGGGRFRVATVMGRYWAMDRDRRWERTERAYRAIAHGEGAQVRSAAEAIAAAHAADETDEFVQPQVIVDDAGEPEGVLRPEDGVIFFNFRADRARQLVRALGLEEFDHFDRAAGTFDLVTLTRYDDTFPFDTAFPPQSLDNILADVLDAHGLSSFRTAETEKYPHVTYFFNGGDEQPHEGEERRLVPSPKVPTYDHQPEMSAEGVTEGLLEAIRARRHDVLVCNYANPDMVGHTGVMEAAVRAVETVDGCLGRVVEACRETGTVLLVTADHGNCEQMWDPTTNGPHTAHTTNPVGIVLFDPREGASGGVGLGDGALCDVAPTILGLLGVPQPEEMTGRDLRTHAGRSG
jgi:2,3-bisphosphoglycerate-independent phosphoglycerate mutase